MPPVLQTICGFGVIVLALLGLVSIGVSILLFKNMRSYRDKKKKQI